MRQAPSKRNLAILAYRKAGNTLRAVADKFGLGVGRVQKIVHETQDYLDAAEALKSDPDNLDLLARTGKIGARTASALGERGIHRIEDLRGLSLRDLLRMPNLGRVQAEEATRLAADRGFEIR
jgi:DNA-directed RNA polymerase alpha subunit